LGFGVLGFGGLGLGSWVLGLGSWVLNYSSVDLEKLNNTLLGLYENNHCTGLGIELLARHGSYCFG
jgi:hypothetical protein